MSPTRAGRRAPGRRPPITHQHTRTSRRAHHHPPSLAAKRSAGQARGCRPSERAERHLTYTLEHAVPAQSTAHPSTTSTTSCAAGCPGRGRTAARAVGAVPFFFPCAFHSLFQCARRTVRVAILSQGRRRQSMWLRAPRTTRRRNPKAGPRPREGAATRNARRRRQAIKCFLLLTSTSRARAGSPPPAPRRPRRASRTGKGRRCVGWWGGGRRVACERRVAPPRGALFLAAPSTRWRRLWAPRGACGRFQRPRR